MRKGGLLSCQCRYFQSGADVAADTWYDTIVLPDVVRECACGAHACVCGCLRVPVCACVLVRVTLTVTVNGNVIVTMNGVC